VIVDLGTGDGRAVLARAAAEPRALVIGIDAHAASMTEASRRASRGRRRAGNVLFLAAAAEALPGPLPAVAALVTITMPWGSLLRGAMGLDRAAMCGIGSVVAPGGRMEILASVTTADRVAGLETLDHPRLGTIARAWHAAGFDLVSIRPATRQDVRATHSSWGRRLRDRPVWRMELRRRATPRARAQDGGH
jgi:16S rRNA (adenine(1408)-N(1))-methyltransferase